MIVESLERDLDINGTLAINGILVEIGSDNVELGEGVHITTTVGTAQTLLDIDALLLYLIKRYFLNFKT